MIFVADVGGMKVRYALASSESEISNIGEVPTPKDIPIWKSLLNLIENYDITAVSLATMGPLKMSEGKIISNPHLNEKSQELARPLMEAIGKPVYVLNDAVAGALAECYARGCQNLVYVAFGTGVGVGVVVDGHLLLGREGNAHEMGHAVLALGSGLRCGCGKEDHAEALLGGSRIAEYLRSKGYRVEDAREAFELIRNNYQAFEYFKKALLAFVSSLVAAYDPEVLVLGGGVFFKNKEVFFKALKHLGSFLLWEAPRVEEAIYGELSPLYGAALVGFRKPDEIIKKLRYVSSVMSKTYH